MSENKSNIYTQTGANSQQIGTQNNYFSVSNPSVKIELKEPYKIYIFNMFKNEEIITILFIALFPLLIFTCIVLWDIKASLYQFLQQLLTFYICLCIGLFLFNSIQMFIASFKSTFKKIDYKNYILIDKEKIVINKEKETNVIIKFEQIRKIEIEKNYMIGYNILIYNKLLEPTLIYNIYYREKALLIKELFEEYLLNKKIEQIINLDNLN